MKLTSRSPLPVDTNLNFNSMMNQEKTYREHMVTGQIAKRILQGKRTFVNVELPEPQRSGTETQQVTYANLKAQEIFDANFRETVYS
jgi:hypothetical protein|tara:strand:- start:496 stop:756 length:261 start_codon:yes stop_codon:yes gene_type:complete